jgi:oligopeptide transport system permease protein
LAAVFGPMLSPYSYSKQSLIMQNTPPTAEHWFGTDNVGRDLLARCLYGARISLAVGVFATAISLILGVLYGGIAGFAGGKTDEAMMRVVDIFYAVPLLLWVILLMMLFKPGLENILIAIGITYWLSMARIVRAQVLSLKEQDYVLAARTIGARPMRIILRHLIPGCIGPILVTATFNIPQAIFTESFLSFIGLGVGAPMASWGMLASDALSGLRSYPYQLFFPALAICITMLAFNFLGDGLRDALDPRLRK